MKELTLNNGVKIPIIGFGTYKATNAAEGYRIVSEAIEVGYRHLDTAMIYKNEEEVGRAVRESGIPREEFFITSKLDRDHLGYENTKREFEATLKRLQTDYLDLYLIHWPRPNFGNPSYGDWERLDRESWKAMEELYREGRIRAIGLSNFLSHHLERLLEYAEIVPQVNQLELHPGYLQKEAVEASLKHDIAIEAWSPIGRARLAENPILTEVAGKYGVSVARLCLAFDLQMGYIIIPKSTHRDRMEENLHADKLTIREEDLEIIRSMPEAGWSGEHPDRDRVDPQVG